MDVESVIEALRQNLPPIFARKEIPKLLGGSISLGTLGNLQSQGYGAPCIRNGRNAIYSREEFLTWFSVYLGGGIRAVKTVYGSK